MALKTLRSFSATEPHRIFWTGPSIQSARALLEQIDLEVPSGLTLLVSHFRSELVIQGVNASLGAYRIGNALLFSLVELTENGIRLWLADPISEPGGLIVRSVLLVTEQGAIPSHAVPLSADGLSPSLPGPTKHVTGLWGQMPPSRSTPLCCGESRRPLMRCKQN